MSLVTKWGGNALIYRLLGATYSAFQLIGAPILGRWSDRYGRRKILLGAALGNGLMWPSGMSRLGERAAQVYQGTVQGFASGVGAVASIVGLVAGGLLYNWLGPWVFRVAAITALIVVGLAASVRL